MRTLLKRISSVFSMEKPPCAGIVVWRNRGGTIQFLMVKSRKGYLSFPKGKKEKGETDMETALRETFEETSVLEKSLRFIRSEGELLTFHDKSKKGNRPVVYYVAECIEDVNTAYQDPDELSWIGWIDFPNLVSKKEDEIKPQRVTIAKEVAKVIISDTHVV